MALRADPAVLAKEAGNFDRIAGELKTVMGHVEAIGSNLSVNLQGGAGTAARDALARFHEASGKVNAELVEISTNIHSGGMQYTSTDHDEASNLASRMQM